MNESASRERCDYRKERMRCSRAVGHDGEHRLRPESSEDVTQVVRIPGPLAPDWKRRLRGWWRRVRALWG